MIRLWLWLLTLLILVYGSVGPIHAGDETTWLLMARRLSGQDDLWARAVSGPEMGTWLRLTASEGDERWPALSPDGKTLAYSARRQSTWDIYLLDLETGTERRLTQDSAYDASPRWSPDGTRLIYSSTLAKDLDIFLADIAAGTPPQNITSGSPAHEYEPAWHPDGETIVYVSTRRGIQRLFQLKVGEEAAVELEAPADLALTTPQWHTEGSQLLVTVGEELDRYLASLDPTTGTLTRLTWTQGERSAAWSPDGQRLVWADERYDEWALLGRTRHIASIPARFVGGLGRIRDITWVGSHATPFLQAQAARVTQTTPPLYIEFPPPSEPGLVTIEGLDTLRPELNTAVAASYQALRTRLRQEVGYDYLGRVSETHRPLTYSDEGSDVLSWHKVGRAFDTLLDLGVPPSQLRLEIVRDDSHNEVYWRILLQCIPNDGSCGAPMLERPWDFSEEARWQESPGKGGHPDRFWPGYWLDFTELAEDYGWVRISSHEDPSFDWRTNKTAIEFWHYEQRDGLAWFDAAREVYTLERLNELITWDVLQEHDADLWFLRIKNIPLPPAYRARPVDLVVP